MPLEASEAIVQIRKGAATSIRLTVFSDGDESDIGTITIGIVDAAGNEVVAPGSAVTDNGDGTYDFTLPAQTDVGLLTATWTEQAGSVFTTEIEVVGGHLFTEDQARSYVTDRLASEAKYSDEVIRSERRRITDWLESETGRSWIPRYRRLVVRGSGRYDLPLFFPVSSVGASGAEGVTADIRQLLSVTVDGVDVPTSEVTVDGGKLLRATVWPRPAAPYAGNVVVELEYGLPHPIAGVDRIALLELRQRLVDSRIPMTATAGSDEFGTYSWEAQNNGRPSRIPEVNAWLRNQDRRVAVG